jgi:O-antigen/teichoic acid export membrane protein
VARAFAIASIERYASLLINLGSTAILSRLLTPGEFGIVVIGFAAAALAEAVRELGGANFIVQTGELDCKVVRCAFTISVGLTFLIAPILFLLADPIAQFYNLPQLSSFLRVFAIGFAVGPIASPVSALLARNLAFGRRGAAVLIVTIVNAGASVLLALQGFSYMSFAWAYVVSNATSTLIYPLLLGDRSIFGVSFQGWRSVLTFGVFGGTARLVGIAGENAVYLVIGRFLPPDGIGLLFRAGSLVTFPERVVVGGATAVALPAFSDQSRRGAPLGPYYVRAVEMLTAIHWPALAVIGILAYPIVRVFLGPQWPETARYVHILTGAAMFNGVMSLTYPLQVAIGAIRLTPLLALIQAGALLSCLYLAAPLGPVAVAWSFWFSVPINVGVSVWLVHRMAPFSVRDLGLCLLRSASLMVGTALGPLVVIAANNWQFDLPLLPAAIAVGLAGCGWFGALLLLQHPLLTTAFAYFDLVRTRLSASIFPRSDPSS